MHRALFYFIDAYVYEPSSRPQLFNMLGGTRSRRTYVLIAAFVLCIFLLGAHISRGQERTAQWVSNLPLRLWDDKDSHVDQPAGNVAGAVTPGSPHKIESADDFKPHFETVLKIPAMTVAEAKKTCTWSKKDPVNFMFGYDIEWEQKDRDQADIQQHQDDWKNFVRNGMKEYSAVKKRYSGRGIVMVAGNYDTIQRAKLMLRQMTALKSTLPVEIHYWDYEISKQLQKELSKMYAHLRFRDLSASSNPFEVIKMPFSLPNFQFKVAAILNSNFAEIILLDADNIPAMKPELLFDSKTYREFGTVFWPDIARTRAANPAWAVTNTPCRMDEYEQESGQLMVDKRRFFYHLQLSLWFITGTEFYYSNFLLGDKDLFRFAWHALKTAYGRPSRWLTSIGTAHGGKFCGHTFGQAYPDEHGEIAFLHGGLLKTVDLAVLEWNRDMGGYYNAYKRASADEQWDINEEVGIHYEDASEYVPADVKAKIKHGESCTDMKNVEARNLDEILPGFEKHFAEIGGYWQLEPDYVPPE
nr:alpha-1,2-mannosyltransferase mnn22 [Quercus suber]